MKLLANPISSPSRTDRFSRSNGGNKSRGRSRSGPIFIRKKTETITPEPSSPKVTCMGQVRARTVSNKRKKRKKKYHCTWMKNALFCRLFDKSSVWKRWGGNKMEEIKKDGSTESANEEEGEKFEVVVNGNYKYNDDVKVSATSPPKNAMLLMRCRSEPYRASSLANQFWGSPEQDRRQEDTNTLKEESSCRDSVQESRIDQETQEKLGFCQDIESSTRITSTKVSARNEETIHDVGPALLTRCKSEPAFGRRLGKFEVETGFWKKKLGLGEMFTTKV